MKQIGKNIKAILQVISVFIVLGILYWVLTSL